MKYNTSVWLRSSKTNKNLRQYCTYYYICFYIPPGISTKIHTARRKCHVCHERNNPITYVEGHIIPAFISTLGKELFLATCKFWIRNSPDPTRTTERQVSFEHVRTHCTMFRRISSAVTTHSHALLGENGRKDVVPKKYHKYVTRSRDTCLESRAELRNHPWPRALQVPGSSVTFWRPEQAKEVHSLSVFPNFTFLG